jgi:hypothetical protein
MMKPDEIDAKEKVCKEELHALEIEAGIVEASDKACRGSLFPHIPDAPYGTEQHRMEIEESEAAERAYVRHRLRSVYFGVADIEVRKKLIAKYRQIEKYRLDWFVNELWQAEAKLRRVRASERYWWIWASLGGVIWVLVGNDVLGVPGAIAGAVVAIFAGVAIAQRDKRQHDSAISEAESTLEQNKANLRDMSQREPFFTWAEESSGEEEVAYPVVSGSAKSSAWVETGACAPQLGLTCGNFDGQ